MKDMHFKNAEMAKTQLKYVESNVFLSDSIRIQKKKNKKTQKNKKQKKKNDVIFKDLPL